MREILDALREAIRMYREVAVCQVSLSTATMEDGEFGVDMLAIGSGIGITMMRIWVIANFRQSSGLICLGKLAFESGGSEVVQ